MIACQASLPSCRIALLSLVRLLAIAPCSVNLCSANLCSANLCSANLCDDLQTTFGRRRWASWVFLCIGLCFTLGVVMQPAYASPQEVNADKAFDSIGSPPWYDKETKSFAPPTVSKDVNDWVRRDGRIAEEKNEAARKNSLNAANAAGNGNWRLPPLDADLVATVFFFLIACVLTVVIIMLAMHALRNYLPNYRETRDKPQAMEIDPAKVVDLPFEVRRATYDNPLSEAEALMRAGRYREAILFLYGYMLLALDHSRKLELQKGKTNRMYLREIRQFPQLRSILAGTMLTFEDVYFGKHDISQERFLVHWNQMDEFHQLASNGESHAQISPEAVRT